MKFIIHAKKKEPLTPSRHAPLSSRYANHFAVHESRPEKRANRTITPTAGGASFKEFFWMVASDIWK